MAEKKRTNKISEVRTRWMARFLNRFLVFRTWLGVTFFVIAFAFFTFLLRMGGDLGRLTITIYGFILLILCLVLIAEYVIKTVNLQRENVSRVYSSVLSVNTVFGLILPLIYFNIILAVVMRALAQMTYLGTFWCNARLSFVRFYYNTEIYSQLNSLIFWLTILTAVLFLFGGLIDRSRK